MAWIGEHYLEYLFIQLYCILQGTGLLRVYDMDHYYLESDTKITDCTQRTSTRLV